MAEDLTPFRQTAARSAQGFESVLNAVREQIQIRQQTQMLEREFNMRKDMFTFQLEEQERVVNEPARQAQAQVDAIKRIHDAIKETRTGINSFIRTDTPNAHRFFSSAIPTTFDFDQEVGDVTAFYVSPKTGHTFNVSTATVRSALTELETLGAFRKAFEDNREKISEDLKDLGGGRMALNVSRAQSISNVISAIDGEEFVTMRAANPTTPTEILISAMTGTSLSAEDLAAIRAGTSGMNIIQDTGLQSRITNERREINVLADRIIGLNPDGKFEFDTTANWWRRLGVSWNIASPTTTEIDLTTTSLGELFQLADKIYEKYDSRTLTSIDDIDPKFVNLITTISELRDAYARTSETESLNINWFDQYLNLNRTADTSEPWFINRRAPSPSSSIPQNRTTPQQQLANEAGIPYR